MIKNAKDYAKWAEEENIDEAVRCCESCAINARNHDIRTAVLRWAERGFDAGTQQLNSVLFIQSQDRLRLANAEKELVKERARNAELVAALESIADRKTDTNGAFASRAIKTAKEALAKNRGE